MGFKENQLDGFCLHFPRGVTIASWVDIQQLQDRARIQVKGGTRASSQARNILRTSGKHLAIHHVRAIIRSLGFCPSFVYETTPYNREAEVFHQSPPPPPAKGLDGITRLKSLSLPQQGLKACSGTYVIKRLHQLTGDFTPSLSVGNTVCPGISSLLSSCSPFRHRDIL